MEKPSEEEYTEFSGDKSKLKSGKNTTNEEYSNNFDADSISKHFSNDRYSQKQDTKKIDDLVIKISEGPPMS